MELHQLEYVLAVAKYKGFTRAAKEINISQPSLSQQISKLESELGVNIFLRTTRSVQLTPIGTEFIQHAKRITAEVASAKQTIEKYRSVENGHLAIGTIPIIGYYRIPHLLTSLQKKHPGISMTIKEEHCATLLHMLQAEEIDIAIVSAANPDPSFECYHIGTDHMVAVVNDQHHFSHRKSIWLHELKNERFITTPSTSGNYQDLLEACRSKGHFEPQVVMQCTTVSTILGLVQEGFGIAVLSSNVVKQDPSPCLNILPIAPQIDRKMFIVVNKDVEQKPQLKLFLDFASKWINLNN